MIKKIAFLSIVVFGGLICAQGNGRENGPKAPGKYPASHQLEYIRQHREQGQIVPADPKKKKRVSCSSQAERALAIGAFLELIFLNH